VHARQSGVVDYLADNDAHALWMARRPVGNLNRTGSQPPPEPARAPHYAADELYGVIPRDTRHPYDVREVIARLVDAIKASGIAIVSLSFGTASLEQFFLSQTGDGKQD